MSSRFYLPLATHPDGRKDGHARARRRKLILIVLGAVLVPFAVLGLYQAMPHWKRLANPLPLVPPENRYLGERVFFRAGAVGSEGIGSALQHFKQSIVLSRALNSTLILASERSEHRYSTSQIYNGGKDTALAINAQNACRLGDHVPKFYRRRLVRGLCAGEAWAAEEMEVIRAEMADCTSIVDLDEEKSIEDLTGCVQEWVRERLAHATPPERSPLTFPPSRPVTVGVHVRWGDTAGVFSHGGFRGSMGISNIQRVLRDIRAEMGQHGVDLTVAMENADSDVLAQLNEPTYTFLDSGDALADLQALSNNDFLLLGESSYGVLAHLIAPPGLSIVELSGHHKYGNTTGFGRNIVFMNRYKPESLRIGEKQ